MPASEPATPNQAQRIQTKPGQVKPTKSSIAYRCIAKQIKQAKQTKQANQSKESKQSTAKQTKTKQATKPTKPN